MERLIWYVKLCTILSNYHMSSSTKTNLISNMQITDHFSFLFGLCPVWFSGKFPKLSQYIMFSSSRDFLLYKQEEIECWCAQRSSLLLFPGKIRWRKFWFQMDMKYWKLILETPFYTLQLWKQDGIFRVFSPITWENNPQSNIP